MGRSVVISSSTLNWSPAWLSLDLNRDPLFLWGLRSLLYQRLAPWTFSRLSFHCLVVVPLVALPTCGCQCHECPYERGKVILLSLVHSVWRFFPPDYAAAQENTISPLKLFWSHPPGWRLIFFWCSPHSAHGSVCGWRDQADPPRSAAVLLQVEGQREEPQALRPARRARVQPGEAAKPD